ncbi:MAG: spondin domain-containing protein [Candidatus Thiodiazotropha sp.]
MEALKTAAIAVLATGTLLLAGCPNNDNDDNDTTTRVSYEVTVANLTTSQPMSPLAAVLHGGSYAMWTIGSSASSGLEQLAEAGDNTELLAEAGSTSDNVMSGNGLILPGQSDTIIIEADEATDLALSFASMLVNTNDAFTGLNARSVASMEVDTVQTVNLRTYDAGTEANSESAATIPGPAGGGEGYNPIRDDNDAVRGHPGVVTSADGLSGSALAEAHRFDNPTARVTITRLQ